MNQNERITYVLRRVSLGFSGGGCLGVDSAGGRAATSAGGDVMVKLQMETCLVRFVMESFS